MPPPRKKLPAASQAGVPARSACCLPSEAAAPGPQELKRWFDNSDRPGGEPSRKQIPDEAQLRFGRPLAETGARTLSTHGFLARYRAKDAERRIGRGKSDGPVLRATIYAANSS